MVVARAATFRTLFAAPSRRIAGSRVPSQAWRQVSRRGYSTEGSHGSKSSSDIPWIIGSVGITVPSAYYLLQPGESDGHGHGHGHDAHEEKHEEPAAPEEVKEEKKEPEPQPEPEAEEPKPEPKQEAAEPKEAEAEAAEAEEAKPDAEEQPAKEEEPAAEVPAEVKPKSTESA